MEICIGVTYRMIPINLLFYNSIPSIISKLFSHTTNFRKRGEIILWSFPRLYSSWVTSLSDPTQSVCRRCIVLTLTELRDSKQLNQTKADMTITQANMLTDYSIVCLAWTVSRKWGHHNVLHRFYVLFCFLSLWGTFSFTPPHWIKSMKLVAAPLFEKYKPSYCMCIVTWYSTGRVQAVLLNQRDPEAHDLLTQLPIKGKAALH